MTYWHCKNGEAKEVPESTAKYLEANGERITSDPFEAAMYLTDCNY